MPYATVNIETEIIKLLERKTEENLHDLRVDKNFSDRNLGQYWELN
jgi:hypothetical protein